MKTREEYEAQARADFAALKDTVIKVYELTAYPKGQEGDALELVFKNPLAVRVTALSEPLHYVHEWLDPYWDVEVVDAEHPELPPGGIESCWMFGHSYNTQTGEEQKTQYQTA